MTTYATCGRAEGLIFTSPAWICRPPLTRGELGDPRAAVEPVVHIERQIWNQAAALPDVKELGKRGRNDATCVQVEMRPYASHLFGVASLVLEHGVDEEQPIAAMVHDAVEDQGAHLESRSSANSSAAGWQDIVLGCTDANTVSKPPWRAL